MYYILFWYSYFKMYNKVVKMVFVENSFVDISDLCLLCWDKCYFDFKIYVFGEEVIEIGILEVNFNKISFFMYDLCFDLWLLCFSLYDVCLLLYGCIDIVIVGDRFYFGG